ncbi:RraA family protein [Acuticoccus kandeliae]|uniref:RraA family protein n=1 Tax=Acuticoccus kandeliae TaxID=2073160 RepID=UPI000D3E742F|nr:RraA family protein [Acuticoccus kandeliae]
MTTDTRLSRLLEVETGMISDCMMRLGLHGWMDGVKAVQGPKARLAGRARTMLFGPKRGEGQWPVSMYRTIAEHLEPGDVWVIAAGGTDENLMGDNVVTQASLHGLAGIVTDSLVRDGTGIAAIDLPVFSRGVTTRLPMTMEPIALDVPVVCAGAQVRPGDTIVGDADGILVLPTARLDDILYQLEDVAVIEKELAAAIAARHPLEALEGVIKRKKARRA